MHAGGECQRIRLAGELHQRGSIYRMNEPTTGLHLADVGCLLTILNRLTDGGNTVIVIEHYLDVMRNTDWIIDLRPQDGKRGQVIFEARHSLMSRSVRSPACTWCEDPYRGLITSRRPAERFSGPGQRQSITQSPGRSPDLFGRRMLPACCLAQDRVMAGEARGAIIWHDTLATQGSQAYPGLAPMLFFSQACREEMKQQRGVLLW